jgi:metal-responsive CopG/Arc/MetJ family transcriptional regulator
MRTTINIDDQLLMQAKAQAAASGVTLAQLIEDALRESLIRRENVENRGRKHGVRSCLLPSSPIVFRHVQTA